MRQWRGVACAALCCARSFFVQFRETPNAACYRFEVEGVTFLNSPDPHAPALSFTRNNSHHSPLAQQVLDALPMVEAVTVGLRFITVHRVEASAAAAGAKAFVAHFERTHGAAVEEEVAAMRAAAAPSGAPQQEEEEELSGGALDEHTVQELIASTTWEDLKMYVSALLTDHLYSGAPHIALDAPHPHSDTLPSEGDSEAVLCIKELVRAAIRPLLQEDGGDIRFVGFDAESGDMKVELLGACRRCRSSKNTLQDLIERTAKHWIPEVVRVVAVEEAQAPIPAAADTKDDDSGEAAVPGACLQLQTQDLPHAHVVRRTRGAGSAPAGAEAREAPQHLLK